MSLFQMTMGVGQPLPPESKAGFFGSRKKKKKLQRKFLRLFLVLGANAPPAANYVSGTTVRTP
jgi:hypothetical protein